MFFSLSKEAFKPLKLHLNTLKNFIIRIGNFRGHLL